MMAFTKWKKASEALQQNFANLLGDRIWDKYEIPKHKQKLWESIAFALFGEPLDENGNRGYKESQLPKISELQDKCIENCTTSKLGKDVYIAFIYVCAFKSSSEQTTVPVMRLKKGSGLNTADSYFIDHCGRVYINWQSFLDDNVFDGWWICVPRNGGYPCEEDVCLKFIDQTKRGQVLQEIDKVSTISNIVTSVSMSAGLIMTFFPPTSLLGAATVTASTIVGAPGAVYGTGRSVGKLVDRGKHDQTLSLLDSEARACWINTAASALSIGTMASTKLLTSTAKVGGIASSGTRVFCTALNATCLSVNGIGVINSIVEISKKDKVTSLDILQLTTSIFFFTHSLVSFRTASDIIKDAQDKKIAAERRNLTPENQAVYDAMLKARREMVEPGKVRKMHGSAEFIREIRNIENKQDFFNAFRIMPDNQLNVQNELIIDSKAFLQMSETERSNILEYSRKLKDGLMSEVDFDNKVSDIRREYRITFERERTQAKSRICTNLGVTELEDLNVGGKQIFKDIKPHEIDRLDQVFKQAGKNYNKECIKAGLKMADKLGCKNITEFAAVTEYTIRQMDAKISSLRKSNPNPSRPAGMKAKDYYHQQVYDDLMNNTNMQDKLMDGLHELRRSCDKANFAGNPRFGNSFAAANHYDKHPFFPNIDASNNLSPERYFEIAREMTNGPMIDPKWTQDGSSLVCQFVSNEYGAMAVRYDNLANGTSVIATLMKNDKVVSCRMYKS